METNANNLVERDTKTNAMTPVFQAYTDGLENTEVVSNYLYIRDEVTNAFVPVVKVLGGNDSGISTVTLSADEYEALEVKDPNTIYYVY